MGDPFEGIILPPTSIRQSWAIAPVQSVTEADISLCESTLGVVTPDHVYLSPDHKHAALVFEGGLPTTGQHASYALELLETIEDLSGNSLVNGSLQFAVTPVVGDYDRSGLVDSLDYSLWKSSFGQAVSIGISADGNGDGVINLADYTVWRDNLGSFLDVGPLIGVYGNGEAIVDGSGNTSIANGTQFPDATVLLEESIHTFVIENHISATSSLELVGIEPVTLAGVNTGDFEVILQPQELSLAPGESTSFQVKFAPTFEGLRSAILLVGTSTTQFDFLIQGTALPTGPNPLNEVESNDSLLAAQDLDAGGWTLAFDPNITDSTLVPHLTVLGTGNNTFDYYSFPSKGLGEVLYTVTPEVRFGDGELRVPYRTATQRNSDQRVFSADIGFESANDSFFETIGRKNAEEYEWKLGTKV